MFIVVDKILGKIYNNMISIAIYKWNPSKSGFPFLFRQIYNNMIYNNMILMAIYKWNPTKSGFPLLFRQTNSGVSKNLWNSFKISEGQHFVELFRQRHV